MEKIHLDMGKQLHIGFADNLSDNEKLLVIYKTLGSAILDYCGVIEYPDGVNIIVPIENYSIRIS